MIKLKDFMDLVDLDTQVDMYDEEGAFIATFYPRDYKNDSLIPTVIWFKAIDQSQMRIWVRGYQTKGGVL